MTNLQLVTKELAIVNCTIKPTTADVDPDRNADFLRVLEQSKFLSRITEKTGLVWTNSEIVIEYAKEANFSVPSTIIIDYDRGARAVSSGVHEAFHLMLRQISWTENPTVKSLLSSYPELITSSRHGPAYKLEQMFAYLLQNEVFQEIADDLHFDASKHYWDVEFIKSDFIPYEFDTEFLRAMALAVIEVWYTPSRSNDIFELIQQVAEKLEVQTSE